MKKIGYLAPRRGGKTQFIIEMINDEHAKGHKCYYLGGKKHYDEIVQKMSEQGSKSELILIGKDITPTEDDCAVFTDNLTWELTSIYPYAVRAMTKLRGNWFYTIEEEGVIILDKRRDDQ